jgi:hypothetical protein
MEQPAEWRWQQFTDKDTKTKTQLMKCWFKLGAVTSQMNVVLGINSRQRLNMHAMMQHHVMI